MNLGARQILDLALAAGFRGEDAITATAIALAESGGNALALNPELFERGQAIPAKLQHLYGPVCTKAYCGDYSLGLWQINMHPGLRAARLAAWNLPSVEALYDPATNARVAYALYRGRGGGFGDWATYLYGQYKNHLGAARAAWALYQAEQAQPAVIPPDPPAGPALPVESGPTSQPEFSTTAAPVSRPGFWSLVGSLLRALLSRLLSK